MNGSFHYLAVIGWHNWGIKQSECISDILLVVPTDKCLIRYNAARSYFLLNTVRAISQFSQIFLANAASPLPGIIC
jgi:hypothetical protein